jgi:hypothetical protein
MLWIDAICINQGNLVERGLQVSLMRMIYRRANKVVIWLGESDSDTEIYLRTINEIVQKSHSLSASDVNRPGELSSAEFFEALVKGVRLKYSPRHEAWPALASFFDRPWFERIWVIQEVTECRFARVLIGDNELPWDSIGLVATWIITGAERGNVLRHSQTRGIQNVQFMCRKELWFSSRTPHLTILQSTRNFNATDLRDKVYAMLSQPVHMREDVYSKLQMSSRSGWWGKALTFATLAMTCLSWSLIRGFIPGRWIIWRILSEGAAIIGLFNFSLYIMKKIPPWRVPGHVKPPRTASPKISWVPATPCSLLKMNADYSVRTIEEVNKIVATQTVLNFRKADFLSYVHHRESLEATTPSWVPKWQEHTDDKDILASFTQCPYNADAGQTSVKRPLIRDDMITLQGIQLGSISQVSDMMSASDFDLKDPPILQKILEEHGREPDLYGPTGATAKEACILTLTASQALTGPRTGRSSETSLRNRLQAMNSVHAQELWQIVQRPGWKSEYLLGSEINHDAARRVCHLRRHFVSASGYQGLGPAQIQHNDIIVVLFGGCCPYVLRETYRNSDLAGYLVVGECYVHGLMDGEAIAEWKKGQLSSKLFLLR